MKITVALFAACMICTAAATGSSHAQAPASYPNRAIRIVAPFPAAGAADIVARLVAQRLSEQLGVPAIVDNRPGASGGIGSELVARSSPDGYSLLVGVTASHGINPALQKLSYDPIRDFAPISLIATIPHVLVVNPASPAKSVQDFLRLAKGRQATTFGSAGVGTPHHLAGEFLRIATGINFVHVPYKGSAPAIADLIGGQIDFLSSEYAAVAAAMKAGKLRALAALSADRIPGLDLPTFTEAGIPGFDIVAWYGLFAPARTPRAIVDLLSREVARGLANPDTIERFNSLVMTPIGSTPEQLAEFMRNDIAKWTRVVKATGVKPE